LQKLDENQLSIKHSLRVCPF